MMEASSRAIDPRPLSSRYARFATVLLVAGSLAACGKKERPQPAPPPPPPPPAEKPAVAAIQAQDGLNATQRLARVVDLLVANDEKAARVELDQLLREDPSRREARVLRQSIEGDPRAMVPAGSFAYVTRPGDTFISLALAYLGDSYKFYALARLNGIAAGALRSGTTIQIPGRYREPRREREERVRQAPPRPREQAETPAAPPPPSARFDPRRAQQLRRAGLESMSAGRINQAVSRLEQAARLDPGNAAVAADLARARRIQATVRQRN